MILFLFFCQSAAGILDEQVLSRYAMIMSHDAATGYLREEDDAHSGEIIRWSKTQQGNLTQQLNCGARAFDWRPMLHEGKVIAHHGDIKIRDAELNSIIIELKSWLSVNPAEFVLFYIWDCSGDSNCTRMTNEILRAHKINAFDSCLGNFTLAQVKNMSRLDSGGYALVVTDCINQNYNESLACSGFFETDKLIPYTCTQNSEYPFDQLFQSLDSISFLQQDSSHTSLFEMQALWQETSDSVIIGTILGSSLLEDEMNSGLNARILQALQQNRWSVLNFLELNYVCDQGPNIFKALQEFNNANLILL